MSEMDATIETCLLAGDGRERAQKHRLRVWHARRRTRRGRARLTHCADHVLIAAPPLGRYDERGFEHPGVELTPAEWQNLRRLTGFMVPASGEYGVPGADDAAIFADIVRSLGRDRDAVRAGAR